MTGRSGYSLAEAIGRTLRFRCRDADDSINAQELEFQCLGI
jgi:hypothetical protein